MPSSTTRSRGRAIKASAPARRSSWQNLIRIAAVLFVSLAALTAQARPNHVVLGYSATWKDAQCPPEYYHFDAMTILARAFLQPRPDGSINIPPDFFNSKIKTLASGHNVKLIMSLGGEAPDANNWLSIARHPDCQDRFFTQLDKLMTVNAWDGFDIDWEPSPVTSEDGAAYISLLKSLRARFPHALITTALPASEYWISHFSWKDVCDNVDFVNVMVYDYSGGWGGRAAYSSNLFPPGAYPPQPEYSVAQGMANLIDNHKVPPAKLLLGLTFWASRFAVDHVGDPFPKDTPGFTENITYAQTLDLLHAGRYKEFWDNQAAMPYLQRTAGGSVVVYENPKSIQLKCQYAAKLGCAGVMIWHVGADLCGTQAPLMDAVAESVGVPKQTFPPQAIDPQIQELTENIRHANADLAKIPGQFALSSAYQLPAKDPQPMQTQLTQLGTQWAQIQDRLWQAQATQRQNK